MTQDKIMFKFILFYNYFFLLKMTIITSPEFFTDFFCIPRPTKVDILLSLQ